MKHEGKLIFAIYKDGNHISNQYGFTKDDAIKEYLIASNYNSFVTDNSMLLKFDAIVAKKNEHFFKSDYIIVPKEND